MQWLEWWWGEQNKINTRKIKFQMHIISSFYYVFVKSKWEWDSKLLRSFPQNIWSQTQTLVTLLFVLKQWMRKVNQSSASTFPPRVGNPKGPIGPTSQWLRQCRRISQSRQLFAVKFLASLQVFNLLFYLFLKKKFTFSFVGDITSI